MNMFLKASDTGTLKRNLCNVTGLNPMSFASKLIIHCSILYLLTSSGRFYLAVIAQMFGSQTKTAAA